jgi:hypothetical protein
LGSCFENYRSSLLTFLSTFFHSKIDALNFTNKWVGPLFGAIKKTHLVTQASASTGKMKNAGPLVNDAILIQLILVFFGRG